MFGVNEDAYWMSYQARVEHWYNEDEDGDLIDDYSEGVSDEWEFADIAFEEERLAKNRSL